VVKASKSGLAWGRLGEAFHAAEFTLEAKLCYSNAAGRDPKDFRWPYLLGTLEQQGEPTLSIQHLTRATELAAGRVDSPRYQLARTLVEQGQFDQAEPHLKLLLAANPYHAAASLELTRVQLARGALRDATRTLQPVLTNSYTMRAGYLLGSQIAQRNNQADVAAQLSRRAAALPRTFDWPDPVLREVQSLRKDRAYLADQVNGYLQQFMLPETEAALNKLLTAFPDDPEGLLLLGRLRYVQKRCPEAEVAYRKHLAQQPDSLNGLIQLGLTLMCQERWSNAVSVLEQAVVLKPDFAQAHNNLGTARSKAGDATGAIRAFRDALRCSPGDINTHMSLAEELANENQIEEAKQHVLSAAALNPNDTRVLRAREQLGIK
jgi:tetratricopeptide (TPR) repeat protein